MPLILDGQKVSEIILKEVAKEVEKLSAQHLHPKLAIILAGENQASLSYVKQKIKSCEATGVLHELIEFPETVTQKEIISKIDELNADPKTHGILVQLPLPSQIYTPEIIKRLDPKKDVDGFHAYNVGKLFLSAEFEDLAPCTPKGVIRLLEHYKIPIQGQEAVVIGASNIVGKPMAMMLLNRKATVTVCHSKTRDLKMHTLKADIVCSAVGKPNFITADMVKEGVIIIDIGFNKLDGKIVGDVDFEKVAPKSSAITPTPGGTGPMTVACLLENVITATKRLSLM